ncbi:cache domain-containing sensor histidine kinase [Cohnella silvisoli]|uniref:Sensor histidine kinase n=1 Tax=Cohnella silvisoli TaxID=2873699 RepID=A0ABV1KMP8_9BACL|nr:sensor histidine kinase [Cohnella silvisoli]
MKISLRKQIIVIFTSIVVIPLSILIYNSYRSISVEIQQSYVENNVQLLSLLNNRIDDYLKQLDQISLSLYSDLLFTQEYQATDNENWAYNLKIKKLMNIYLQRSETNSVLFYIPYSSEVYIINKSINASFSNAPNIEATSGYSRAMQTKGKYVLEPQHRLKNFNAEYQLNSSTPVFSINRIIQTYSKDYGLLSINYELTYLEKITKDIMHYSDEFAVLTNQSGSVIYQSDPSIRLDSAIINSIISGKALTGSFPTQSSSSDQLLVVYSKSDSSGNILLKTIRMKVLLAQASKSKNLNLMIGAALLCSLIGAIIVVSYRITAPLLKLERHIGLAGKGFFNIPIAVTSGDEIGRISVSYNRMLGQLDQLINEKYKLKLKNKSAELKALQAQINPHFIYNTLQAIGSVALEEGIKELEEMTIALSNMLRYSIKSAGMMVTLEDEINNSKDYLSIQKFRFEEKLVFRIEIADELRSIQIPKLILQPILENSVIHGIERKKTPSTIEIRCKALGEVLSITVGDDGVGMDSDKLAQIRTTLSRTDDEFAEGDSIGIANVYQRLRLLMGDQFEMNIRSESGKGTTVEMLIHVDDNIKKESRDHV